MDKVLYLYPAVEAGHPRYQQRSQVPQVPRYIELMLVCKVRKLVRSSTYTQLRRLVIPAISRGHRYLRYLGRVNVSVQGQKISLILYLYPAEEAGHPSYQQRSQVPQVPR